MVKYNLAISSVWFVILGRPFDWCKTALPPLVMRSFIQIFGTYLAHVLGLEREGHACRTHEYILSNMYSSMILLLILLYVRCMCAAAVVSNQLLCYFLFISVGSPPSCPSDVYESYFPFQESNTRRTRSSQLSFLKQNWENFFLKKTRQSTLGYIWNTWLKANTLQGV